MSQTLVNISHVKEGTVAAAIDDTATIIANAGFNTAGIQSSSQVGSAARKVTTSAASSLISEVLSGTDAAISMSIQPKGVGVVALAGTTVANASVQVPTVASSVNFAQVSGAATGGVVEVLGTGTDGTVDIAVRPKSTGSVWLGGTTTANASAKIITAASVVNQLILTPGATGVAPSLTVGGSGADANRNLNLQGIGTGSVAIKGGTAAANAASGIVGETIGDMVFGTATTATITLTQANPGVITWTTHGFSTQIPQPVVFTTSSALPTNITAGTVYYTVPSSVTANTFQIATSVANAFVPTPIDTTAGSNTGTQTGTAGCKMANTTAINVTGLNLTAGDWDVWGQIVWNANAATTWTTLEGSLSQTSATLATSGAVRGSTYFSLNQISAAATNGVTSLEVGPCIVNVSSTTPVYLVVKGAFATNILGAFGNVMARRRV